MPGNATTDGITHYTYQHRYGWTRHYGWTPYYGKYSHRYGDYGWR